MFSNEIEINLSLETFKLDNSEMDLGVKHRPVLSWNFMYEQIHNNQGD